MRLRFSPWLRRRLPTVTTGVQGLFLFLGRGQRRARYQVQSEPLEPRICLSSVGFISHEVLASDLHQPNQIATADLDGDGDIDTLVSSARGIGWYKNIDGKGTFGPKHSISEIRSFGTKSMQVGDIDGDGDLDVIAASARSSTENEEISWYENDGQGGFASQHFVVSRFDALQGVHTQPGYINLADLDADGDLDLLYGAWQKLVWFENISGTFARKSTFRAESGLRDVLTSDINGDGISDVVIVHYDKIVWFNKSNADGSLEDPKTVAENVGESEIGSVLITDVDGDGDPDVVAALCCTTRSRIGWFENEDGNGAFGDRRGITTSIDRAWSLVASDIDGDGDQDVVFGSYRFNNFSLSWIENTDGAGNFGRKTRISGAPVPRAISAADLDGDGDNDVLGAIFGSHRISWFENTDGAGGFASPKLISASDLHGVNQLQPVDIDLDGDLDVLTLTSGFAGHSTLVWIENLEGKLASRHVIADVNRNVYSVFASDWDGDGDIDLLAASGVDGLWWYERDNNDATFAEHQLLATWSSTVITTDVDTDGDLDIVSRELFFDPDAQREIVWYENKNGDIGDRRIILPNAPNTPSIHPADLDGDGDTDLLFGNQYGRDRMGVVWYENQDGRGSFGAPRRISDRFAVNTASAADVDGDGDLDVITASYTEEGEDEYTDRIVWFENTDGQGTFWGGSGGFTRADRSNFTNRWRYGWRWRHRYRRKRRLLWQSSGLVREHERKWEIRSPAKRNCQRP